MINKLKTQEAENVKKTSRVNLFNFHCDFRKTSIN